MPIIRIPTILQNYSNAAYKTTNSAAFDICANEVVFLKPGERQWINTGLSLGQYNADAIHISYEGQTDIIPFLRILSRSSLAGKGIDVGAGVIDADYVGQPIKVLMINNSAEMFIINIGDRIAQGIWELSIRPNTIAVSEVKRSGGFGSTEKGR